MMSRSWSWRWCLLFYSWETFFVERDARLNSSQNWWGGLHRHLSLTSFLMKSFCSLWRHSTWGKYFSVLFITDLNTLSFVGRSLITAISHVSSASVMLECWQNLLKLTNHGEYQILLLSSPTFILSLPLTMLSFYFLACCFLHCAPTNWMPGRFYTCAFHYFEVLIARILKSIDMWSKTGQ